MSQQGYQIPVHQALVKPILLAGAPRKITILNGTIAAALSLGMHSFWGIPVGILIQVVAVALTKKDEHFFEVIRRHIKRKHYFSV